ncbi:peptidoglycan glycosyltransferase [Candidatus Electrothrix aarhusensis]|uniref:Peptidoglycan glycosyltransferase n=1 Tax=Candidatus Electrothrix aarhusensis TaxID=1859131 RepID=A0A444ITU4_9BACT|nr:peptidoglycan glycosyltransferase [Candidatus Electrothrix aarhusensis]
MKNFRKQNRKRPPDQDISGWPRDVTTPRITHINDGELDFYRRRAMYSSVVLVFFFVILITRLWYLQIQRGEEYTKMAKNNRVRYLEIAAPRGNILDRKGREIVTNRPSFNVVWVREKNRVDDALIKKTASILDIEISELLARTRKMVGTPGHVPIRLAEELSWDQVAYIENNRMELPGIKIEVVPQRVYHYGNLASHVIGYLGEINPKELSSIDSEGYRSGDMIGKMGLEKLREKDLRGEKGRHYMEVNALGFEQRNLKGLEPLPGNDVQLTIDVDLQRVAEELMMKDDKSGAVVAIEVNTGRLLMVASSPVLELDKFLGGISVKNWKDMLTNPHHPLINKIVQGQYPPASTYKIVTAIAGLAEGVITPESSIYCPGHYRFGNRTYRCWKKTGHGAVNLKHALSESCDVYFYQVGQRLGVNRIAGYATRLGLGRKTGVEMEHEKSGLIPTSDWKMKRYKRAWQEGETLSIAIGQGFNLVTPLQLALMTATVANGGTLYKPGMIETVKDPDGHIIEQFHPTVLDRFDDQGSNLKIIKEGLIEAVNGRRGTARRAKMENITVAGKTGTAQVVRLKQYKHLKEEDIPYKYRDHAWFTCFAPAERPEIAVTVLVEHGLHGGSVAAPIAKAVLEKYFGRRGKNPEETSSVVLFHNEVADAGRSSESIH